jgi:hypothetical protein
MKLTKGKIRKLYNKRNQSLKKYKNKKASYERKTFRNKRSVNLARKTLKKISGGADDQKPGFLNRFKEGAKGTYNKLFGSKQPVVLDTGFNQMQPGANVENSNVQLDDPTVINPLQSNAPQNDIVQDPTIVPQTDIVQDPNIIPQNDIIQDPNILPQNDIVSEQPIITNSENAIVGPNTPDIDTSIEQTQGTENDAVDGPENAVVPVAKDQKRFPKMPNLGLSNLSKSASSYLSKGYRKVFPGKKPEDIPSSAILDKSAIQDPSGIVTNLDETIVQSVTQNGLDASAIQVPTLTLVPDKVSLDPSGMQVTSEVQNVSAVTGPSQVQLAPPSDTPTTQPPSPSEPSQVQAPSPSEPSGVTPSEVPTISNADPPVVPASVTPPASQQTPGNEIANSLTTVTNYFADIIANKITQKLPNPTYQGTYQDKLQDGFVAVSKAAETMAKSGTTTTASIGTTTASTSTTPASRSSTDISGNTAPAITSSTDISGNITAASTTSTDISGNTTTANTENTSSPSTSKPPTSKGGKIYKKTKRFRLTNNKTKNAR